ncbi:hypothetical protein BBP40_008936 [Aspergillus hancockii]|nr:hypothetical protein BBP40_008936 [Aspergillus hancockii]
MTRFNKFPTKTWYKTIDSNDKLEPSDVKAYAEKAYNKVKDKLTDGIFLTASLYIPDIGIVVASKPRAQVSGKAEEERLATWIAEEGKKWGHDRPGRRDIRAPRGRSSVPNHPKEAITSHRSPPTRLDLERDGLEFSTVPSPSRLRDDATSMVTLSSDWGDEDENEDENEDDVNLDLETEYLQRGRREKARIQWLVQRVVVRDTESRMVARQLKRKATRRWTEPEYERLVELFAVFGPRWESILETDQKHPRGPQIHPSRTGVDLKDKMRNHKIKLLRDGREIPLRLHCIQLTRNHTRQIAKHRAHVQLTQRLPLQNRRDGANARRSPPPSRAPTKEQPPTFKWPREII